MDLMSSGGNIRCLFSDYNQPNNRSTSLKLSRQQQRHQQHSMNKINQKAFTRDFINCCDDRIIIMEPCEKKKNNNNRLGTMMRWQNVLVFSVVVLINIASINCAATRQNEGES